MTVYNGPSVVNDRIALHVDFANTKCYSGTGTDVYDLSSNGYNGTIVSLGSEVSYNSNGWLDFTGTDGASVTYGVSQLSTDPSLGLGYASGEITYEAWVYPLSVVANQRIMSTDRSDYNCLMNDSNNTVEWALDGDPGFNTASGSYTANNWYHVVGTASRSASNRSTYLNGSLSTSGSKTIRNPMGDGTTRPFAIGSNVEAAVENNSCFHGRIAIVRIYGKALSADEARQNFEAGRLRFGL